LKCLVQGIGEEDDAEKVALKAAIKISMSRQHDEMFATLAFAAKAGDVELVRQLLRRGAEINDVDYDGRSVLAMVKRSGTLCFVSFRCHDIFYPRLVLKGATRLLNYCLKKGLIKTPKIDGDRHLFKKPWKTGICCRL
jgi:hypothetical protein